MVPGFKSSEAEKSLGKVEPTCLQGKSQPPSPRGRTAALLEQGCGKQTEAGRTRLGWGITRQGKIATSKCSEQRTPTAIRHQSYKMRLKVPNPKPKKKKKKCWSKQWKQIRGQIH